MKQNSHHVFDQQFTNKLLYHKNRMETRIKKINKNRIKTEKAQEQN